MYSSVDDDLALVRALVLADVQTLHVVELGVRAHAPALVHPVLALAAETNVQQTPLRDPWEVQ